MNDKPLPSPTMVSRKEEEEEESKDVSDASSEASSVNEVQDHILGLIADVRSSRSRAKRAQEEADQYAIALSTFLLSSFKTQYDCCPGDVVHKWITRLHKWCSSRTGHIVSLHQWAIHESEDEKACSAFDADESGTDVLSGREEDIDMVMAKCWKASPAIIALRAPFLRYIGRAWRSRVPDKYLDKIQPNRQEVQAAYVLNIRICISEQASVKRATN